MSDVYRIDVTLDQLHAIRLALNSDANWYEKYAAGDEWYLSRAKENRAIVAYLDEQMPLSSHEEPR